MTELKNNYFTVYQKLFLKMQSFKMINDFGTNIHANIGSNVQSTEMTVSEYKCQVQNNI